MGKRSENIELNDGSQQITSIATRIAGRRQLSEREPFDVILLVVLGDLVQQGSPRATNP